MNVAVIGAGRMGLRHVRGAAPLAGEMHVVDPRPEARAAAQEAAGAAGAASVHAYSALDELTAVAELDLVVFAETAAGRLERVQELVRRGARRLLIEKPLEQSRARVRALVAAVEDGGADAWCNHVLRAAPITADLREAGGPYAIALTGGAYGIACNGIHWIDLALALDGGAGTLVHGRLDELPIASGRGPAFRDYGGQALYAFGNGSGLWIACDAGGSAPMAAIVTAPTRQAIVDLGTEGAVLHIRDPESDLPPYRYGADYERRDVVGVEASLLSAVTRSLVASLADSGPRPPLPAVAESAVAHELLFDFLELGGETAFPIT